MISGYLGNSSKFDEAIASLAMTYADQNERDHQAFLEAIRDGKIQVYQEQQVIPFPFFLGGIWLQR